MTLQYLEDCALRNLFGKQRVRHYSSL